MVARLSLGLLACLFAFARPGLAQPARAALISDVKHAPPSPGPDTDVVVTAKVASGATKVALKVQAVAPGKYIRKADAEYEKDWTDLPMHDDGKDGDAKANDGIFSATVPASYQKHRWLIRYRVTAVDAAGKAVRAPDAQDACPNFAWWCDSGPAGWVGASQPGKTPALTFSPDFLGTMQALHLIARTEDVAKSQWDGNFHRQKQQGTVVYRGAVYDHIQYSNRGQGSAHISGKNKWGLKFAKGHDLPFLDHEGKPFAECDGLALNPGQSTPYLPVHRGIAGLDEVLSMRSYRLAGVPSPLATWVQWRVVTEAEEVNAKDQYKGDLWGLYTAVGEMEPAALADKKLPDGLTVSIQSGVKHVPKEFPRPEDAQKAWETFISGARGNQKEDWWRKNLDLPAYYSFHAMNRLLANVDVRPDGNHGYYRNPEGKWAPIPWDMDMMFVPRHHQPGHIDAARCLQHPALALEYRNRAREILDLFVSDASPNGGQVGQLVTDLGAALAPKKFDVDWAKLDEARWNFAPRMNQKGSYFVNPARGDYFGGPFTRRLAAPDLAGFQKYLIEFCTDSRPGGKYAPNDGDQRGYGWGYLAHEAKDDQIPAKPTVTRPKAGEFRFEAEKFSSPAGSNPAALEWRVGRVGQPGWYELAPHWAQELAAGTSIEIPRTAFAGAGEYRVR
ncbi:MAG: choice-of-anchor X domain-containing protein, partial [Gemmata sp.]